MIGILRAFRFLDLLLFTEPAAVRGLPPVDLSQLPGSRDRALAGKARIRARRDARR
jgi:hypothetical protein